MEDKKTYGVYIRVDESNRIIAVNSEGLIEDLSGYIRIGEYESDVPYAQGNYFGESIIDERGVWRYAYDPDSEAKWRERTQEEMDADYVEPEPVVPTEQRIAALEADITNTQLALCDVYEMLSM